MYYPGKLSVYLAGATPFKSNCDGEGLVGKFGLPLSEYSSCNFDWLLAPGMVEGVAPLNAVRFEPPDVSLFLSDIIYVLL